MIILPYKYKNMIVILKWINKVHKNHKANHNLSTKYHLKATLINNSSLLREKEQLSKLNQSIAIK